MSASSRASSVMTSFIAGPVYAGAPSGARSCPRARRPAAPPSRFRRSRRVSTPPLRRRRSRRRRASGNESAPSLPARGTWKLPSGSRMSRSASRSLVSIAKRPSASPRSSVGVVHEERSVVGVVLSRCAQPRRAATDAWAARGRGCGATLLPPCAATCAGERSEKWSTSIGMPRAERVEPRPVALWFPSSTSTSGVARCATF